MEKVIKMPVVPEVKTKNITFVAGGNDYTITMEIPSLSVGLGIVDDIANHCIKNNKCFYLAIDTIFISTILYNLSDLDIPMLDEKDNTVDVDAMYNLIKYSNIREVMLSLPEINGLYQNAMKEIEMRTSYAIHSSSRVDSLIDELHEVGAMLSDENFMKAIENQKAINTEE